MNHPKMSILNGLDGICATSGNISFQEILVSFLLAFATIACSLYSIAWVYNHIRKRVMVSLQISGWGVSRETSDENIYNSVLRWIASNPACASFKQHMLLPKVVALPDGTNQLSDNDEFEDVKIINQRQQIDLGNLYRPPSSPNSWKYSLFRTIGLSSNLHSFHYKNATIHVSRNIENSQEILTLSTLPWNRHLLLQIVSEAKPTPKDDDQSTTIIYKANQGGGWARLGGPKTKRPLTSLVLDGSILPNLVDDIKTFLKMEDWYVEKGIPYRRGYLLHGPPGCGKSSIVKAIAGDINYNICVLSLSQNLTDDSVTELLNQAPTKSIILLEDIDAAFGSREAEAVINTQQTDDDGDLLIVKTKQGINNNFAFEGKSNSLLTFRGLLNALDGVGSSDDGQLVFMTTNYPERLDPALIRPGRVDLKIHIDYPDGDQIVEMFSKFYPTEDEIKEEFVKVIKGMKFKVSLAMIQGLLLVYRSDPVAAVKNAEKHFKDQFHNPYSTDGKRAIYS